MIDDFVLGLIVVSFVCFIFWYVLGFVIWVSNIVCDGFVCLCDNFRMFVDYGMLYINILDDSVEIFFYCDLVIFVWCVLEMDVFIGICVFIVWYIYWFDFKFE